MALELLTIASGSKGNCLIIRNSSCTLILDMGISFSEFKAALSHYRIRPQDIDGVLVTHEHTDHISGLKTFFNNCETFLYAHRETHSEIDKRYNLCGVRYLEVCEAGFGIKDIDIQPFRTRHDAAHPLGYRFSDRTGSIGVATDLGCMTPGVLNNLKGCSTVFIESNHDVNMLKNGPYPVFLQKRILSNDGHLSNEACAETVAKLAVLGTTNVILGHLSENNNTRRLAYSATAGLLEKNGATLGADIELDIAAPRGVFAIYPAEAPEMHRKIV